MSINICDISCSLWEIRKPKTECLQFYSVGSF